VERAFGAARVGTYVPITQKKGHISQLLGSEVCQSKIQHQIALHGGKGNYLNRYRKRALLGLISLWPPYPCSQPRPFTRAEELPWENDLQAAHDPKMQPRFFALYTAYTCRSNHTPSRCKIMARHSRQQNNIFWYSFQSALVGFIERIAWQEWQGQNFVLHYQKSPCWDPDETRCWRKNVSMSLSNNHTAVAFIQIRLLTM
jgi:hypothetical protein